jgi:hypothetical protein
MAFCRISSPQYLGQPLFSLRAATAKLANRRASLS